MLSKEEVQHIAKLARLGLSQEEIGKFQKELSSILDYFEKLKKVNVAKVEPMSHSVSLENVSRKDEGIKNPASEKILKLVPQTQDGYLKVKSILKQDESS